MKKDKISPELHAIYKAVVDPNKTHAEKLAAIGAQGDVIRDADVVYPDTGNGEVPTGAQEAKVIKDTKVLYPDLGGAPSASAPAATASNGRSPMAHRRAPVATTIMTRPVVAQEAPAPAAGGGILDFLGIRKGPFIGKGFNSPDAPEEEVAPAAAAATSRGGPTPEALRLIAAAKKSHAARQPVQLIYDDKTDTMMTPNDIIHRQAVERSRPAPVEMFTEGDEIRTPEEQLLYARSKGGTLMSPSEDAAIASMDNRRDPRIAR